VTAQATESTVRSADGTSIAFERAGTGPALILVDGALSFRGFGPMEPLAALLVSRFTVFTYDRRGRGKSTDTQPYAVKREIEDIEALIEEAGGSVCLYGVSSGAALALKAAARLRDNVTKLALYEPPFTSGDEAKHDFAKYTEQMDALLAANRRGDAVAFFLADRMPAEELEGMRQTPEWPIMEALAPTLAYDNAVMGDGSPPVDESKTATMPALVLDGSESPEFMHEAADAVARAMPRAQRLTLEGQTHMVSPEVLGPVLTTYFQA
jgi:pimeloyl-ACP methyl ester carboxylesterase